MEGRTTRARDKIAWGIQRAPILSTHACPRRFGHREPIVPARRGANSGGNLAKRRTHRVAEIG
eukprot:2539613-Lingulodinium_polyedra.AAC.1